MRRGHPVLALLAALAALACAQSRWRHVATTTTRAHGGSADGKVIERNADNASTSITVGSKNFTEQFILGEIYAQALQAAGYDVKKDLNLGSEQIALRALKSGDVDGYPEYTSTALTSFFDVQPQDIPKDPQQAVTEAQDDFAQEGLVAYAPTPFTSANAVGMLKKQGRRAGRDEGLRPRGQVPGPDPVRVARVPPAARLPGRAAGGLRPAVQEVHARRHRPALRRARQGPGRPLDHLHDRRAAVDARRRGHARGRQAGVPARQRDVRRQQGDGRRRRARTSRPRSRRSRRDSPSASCRS